MGEFGSFTNTYKLDETIPELLGVSVCLDGENDDFIGDCPKCKKYFDIGADIKDGKVEEVFILKQKVQKEMSIP